MKITELVTNRLSQDASGIWRLENHDAFEYTDGADSEKYLENVFETAKDLSSASSELEKRIKDWPSEYHLSTKRAQLFSGFEFDQDQRVLEVGCGCGAITRYLGESFDSVVSIEGSYERARLARMRTRDLDSVSIVCAPFQDIDFSAKFDIVFCVGVFEYSGSFVNDDQPYSAVLAYLASIIRPGGILIIAIENQFGLKYLSGVREDHTGIVFDGIQGYAKETKNVRTFGKYELEKRLQTHFQNTRMYYPFPDYKMPTSVISEEFIESEDSAELISQFRSRDYKRDLVRLWDENLVKFEMSKNGMNGFFADSFLVLASDGDFESARFPQYAIVNSSDRIDQFRTCTRIQELQGEITAVKQLKSGLVSASKDNLLLEPSASPWCRSQSLASVVRRNCHSSIQSLAEIFAPCLDWVEFLVANSVDESGKPMLDGVYLDCNFGNVFIEDGRVTFIDDEWRWKDKIALNVVVVRVLHQFLKPLESVPGTSKKLNTLGYKSLIVNIAETIGVRLQNSDFAEFLVLESEFQFLANDGSKRKTHWLLFWTLYHRPSVRWAKCVVDIVSKVRRRVARYFA